MDYSSTPEALAELFGQAGPVERVTIPGYSFGQPQGYAMMEFATAEAQSKAISMLNGHEFNGRALKVNMSSRRSIGAHSIQYYQRHGALRRPRVAARRFVSDMAVDRRTQPGPVLEP